MTKEEYLEVLLPKIEDAYTKNDLVLLKSLCNQLNSSMSFIDETFIKAHAQVMEFFLENNKIEGFEIIYNELKMHLDGDEPAIDI